jgi:PAS domain S-box-containing protein
MAFVLHAFAGLPLAASDLVGYVTFFALGTATSWGVNAILAARRRAVDSQRWLAAVLECIGEAVIATDREGRVVLMNPVSQALTGWDREEAIGKPLDEVFHPISEDTREAIASPAARVFRDGAVVGLGNHTILVGRTGAERPVDENAAPIRDEDGRLEGVVMVFRDVSERQRAAQAVRAALDSAQAANRAKDHFLAVLSHELRTPLTPALLVVSSLAEDRALPDHVRTGLEETRHNLELETRLIDDLLDVSRILRGGLEMKSEPVDVHALIGRALEICRNDLDSAQLEVATDLAARRAWVEGDAARLLQVLWNLLRNATKFTPGRGQVRITTRNEGGDESTIVLEVADTGIGIEPELLPRIFDAFEQGEGNSWTRRAGGLGLGLTIARSVVQALGGTLTPESAGAYQGAKFAIRLATITNPVPSTEPVTVPTTRSSAVGLRLLLVEDDEPTARILGRLLRGRGHSVTIARTVAEALQTLPTAGFDVLLSDIGLPDGNGLDLMRRIRADRPLRGIALSGFGMDDDVRRSREAGFAEHLTKPVEFSRLEAALMRVATLGADGSALPPSIAAQSARSPAAD